jgi:hypothetical protein|tara:strand:+ start:615 stop:788 length:174 start_codon:yes stop_codon:yes gene_type:complete
MDEDIKTLKSIWKDFEDLSFDYDRMSSCGQKTYDKIHGELKSLLPKIAESLQFYNDA